MELITHAIALSLGLALGFAGYRYYLKRNPANLEAWARRIKLASDAAKTKLGD